MKSIAIFLSSLGLALSPLVFAHSDHYDSKKYYEKHDRHPQYDNNDHYRDSKRYYKRHKKAKYLHRKHYDNYRNYQYKNRYYSSLRYYDQLNRHRIRAGQFGIGTYRRNHHLHGFNICYSSH